MYCPKCGKENPDDAQLCQSCSCVLTQSTVTAESVNIKTSGMAIASMVLGILSVFTCGITFIPAVILGIISLVQIEKSGGRVTGRGFAIAGIVVPVLTLIIPMMAILMPALNRAREQGKRAVCLNNLRQLTFAWIIYADENEDMIVNGAAGSDRVGVLPWVGKDWHTDDLNAKRDAILNGALWPYCKNLQLYRCPSGIKDEIRTYSIVNSMNGVPRPRTQEDNVWVKTRGMIRNQGRRVVFIDVGRAVPDSFAVYYDKEQWWDPPPIRHSKGTNVSFADGHAEYWKWKDSRTIKWGLKMKSGTNDPQAIQEGNEDIRRVQEAVWGKLGYTTGAGD